MSETKQKPISEIDNYMELADLLVNAPYVNENLEGENPIVIQDIINRKEIIDRIYEVVSQVGMFIDSKQQREEFINDIEKDEKVPTLESKAIHSYSYFLYKSVHAPTTIHLRGVVILTVPIIKHFLDGYLNSKENKG